MITVTLSLSSLSILEPGSSANLPLPLPHRCNHGPRQRTVCTFTTAGFTQLCTIVSNSAACLPGVALPEGSSGVVRHSALSEALPSIVRGMRSVGDPPWGRSQPHWEAWDHVSG